jgi:hypothetical protein
MVPKLQKTPVVIPDDMSQKKYLKMAESVEKWIQRDESQCFQDTDANKSS